MRANQTAAPCRTTISGPEVRSQNMRRCGWSSRSCSWTRNWSRQQTTSPTRFRRSCCKARGSGPGCCGWRPSCPGPPCRSQGCQSRRSRRYFAAGSARSAQECAVRHLSAEFDGLLRRMKSAGSDCCRSLSRVTDTSCWTSAYSTTGSSHTLRCQNSSPPMS